MLVELIIVDDCSTDNSYAEAKRIASGNDRIRVLKTPVNSGPGAARNMAAERAMGSHLSFLDADDELLEDYFTEALDLLAAHPEMSAIKTDEEFFDPVKGYILPSFDPRYQAAVLSSVPGLVIDKFAFNLIGGFPVDPIFRGPFGGEDVAFMQALMAHFQPLGRIGRACYRVWSQAGSHVDTFLANTRLTKDGFEFVHLHPDQQPEGPLAKGLAVYLDKVEKTIKAARDPRSGRP